MRGTGNGHHPSECATPRRSRDGRHEELAPQAPVEPNGAAVDQVLVPQPSPGVERWPIGDPQSLAGSFDSPLEVGPFGTGPLGDRENLGVSVIEWLESGVEKCWRTASPVAAT